MTSSKNGEEMGGEACQTDFLPGSRPAGGGDELDEGEDQKLTWLELLTAGGFQVCDPSSKNSDI